MVNKKKKNSFLNKKISNRLSYTIIGVLILITLAIGVYSYGGTAPSVMGHTFGEIAPPSGCLPGQALVWDGSAWSCIPLSGTGSGISGTGTTNYLAKWTGATAIGNSVVSETGGNLLLNAWNNYFQFGSITGPKIYGLNDGTTEGFPGDDVLVLYSGEGGTFGQGTGGVRIFGGLIATNNGDGIKTRYNGIESVGKDTLYLQGQSGKNVEIGMLSINSVNLTVNGVIKSTGNLSVGSDINVLNNLWGGTTSTTCSRTSANSGTPCYCPSGTYMIGFVGVGGTNNDFTIYCRPL